MVALTVREMRLKGYPPDYRRAQPVHAARVFLRVALTEAGGVGRSHIFHLSFLIFHLPLKTETDSERRAVRLPPVSLFSMTNENEK